MRLWGRDRCPSPSAQMPEKKRKGRAAYGKAMLKMPRLM